MLICSVLLQEKEITSEMRFTYWLCSKLGRKSSSSSLNISLKIKEDKSIHLKLFNPLHLTPQIVFANSPVTNILLPL